MPAALTKADQAAAHIVPHSCWTRLTSDEQALIVQHTPLRFATYTPTLLDGASDTGSSPPFAEPVLEPYLPLSVPTSSGLSLILTPPRISDVPALVEALNDSRVAPQLIGPPYPYTEKMAEEYITLMRGACMRMMQRLGERAARALKEPTQEGSRPSIGDGDEPWLDDLPLCVIRRSDTGEYVGDFGTRRWQFEDVLDEEERQHLLQANEAKSAADRTLLWSFGFYLHPKFHGLGIMSHILHSVLDTFFFSYLGIDEVRGQAFADNAASVKSQEKCGLRAYRSYEREISETRGGGSRRIVALKLRKEDFYAQK